jgi:hypothetical protein
VANLSDRFQLYNDQQTKNIVIVLDIDGVPGVLSSSPVYTRVRYGDPDIFYGDPGLVYGGLRPLLETNGGDVQSLIMLDGSSLTLSQKIEPEQGRGSVSTLSFQLLDKNGYITQLFSPGVIVEEILNRGITVYLGYTDISYPEDFHQIFRGRISQVQGGEGFGFMQISDPNTVRRQTIFYTAKTKLVGAINNSVTTINVLANTDFHRAITGPDGSYSEEVRTFIRIEDEIIEYGPTFNVPTGTFGTNTWTNVVRGALGTTAASHDDDSEVEAMVQLAANPMDMALKVMLSGSNGAWIEDQPLASIVFTGDPILLNQPKAYILPNGIDATREYNLTAGDYITVTGATNPANNGTFTVVSFGELAGTENRIIYTDNAAAVYETPSPALFSIRSQYDIYPETCGSGLDPLDVDIDQHEYLKQTFLGIGNQLRILIDKSESGKTFLEAEVYLPNACYSLTREGRLSVGLTKPPLALPSLPFLDVSNVLNAPMLRPTRGTNNRKFFNEIAWEFDANNAGEYTNTYRQLDTESLSKIGLSSVLPIKSKGLHTDLGAQNLIEKRSSFLLSRFKNGAVQIEVLVNYGTGVGIEAGDVVALADDGQLQIQNWSTGDRDLGTQLYEVIERTLDLKTGNVKMNLIAGLGAQITDRYGTISPSTKVGTGSTTTVIVIEDSYGAIFPGDEKKKWEDYIGLTVLVHSEDWQTSDEVTLVGFDVVDPYKMIVDPALSFTPTAGYVVDIPFYPTSTDPYVGQLYKSVHSHLDPSVEVTAGVSTTVFEVGVGDIAKFAVGQTVMVHSNDWTIESPEVTVDAVDLILNRITVDTSLGFTPAAGQRVEYIGFADGSGAYRWI